MRVWALVGLVICHTADWHLGRTLHGASFEVAHRRFLAWLVALIAARAVDVLIVAGDVFDRSVPSAAAEALFYGFLSELARVAPGTQVIVVAGNHDGPARLAAPAPLLSFLGSAHLGAAARLPVTIVASLPITKDGAIDVESLVVPLRTRAGVVRGRLIAVPFLRPSDLSRAGVEAEASAIERARAIHTRLVRAAEGEGLLIATGHGQLRGARLSPESERPLLGGDEAALPIDVFPRAIDYVALGHLHLAQSLDEGRVRYAGAPLPLAFSERHYPHQVVIAREGEDARGLTIDEVRVPRFVELVRVEGEGGAPLSLEDALRALAALRHREVEVGEREAEVRANEAEVGERWVQVRVRLASPRAALKRELTEALEGARQTKLVSVDVVRDDASLVPQSLSVSDELAPDAVLARV
ncbi:MAG: exonuclease subunit SbcD, partial [Deltaproteobacteria bacterium]|nr:exonuclease subunit SbcD [Deltaproteobacteria bacterium]